MSIRLENVVKRYEDHPVVNHVSLEIQEGEFFVLIGPSGSGKSTILRLIAGLSTPDEGQIWLHGQPVSHLPPQQREVGFVFQHYALFRHMTVAQNIEFALRVRQHTPLERRKRKDELLDIVGLVGLGNRMPHQLSGGQQQRVALARALAHRPKVLLLDEPFGALDAKIRGELRRTLSVIQKELGVTTLFVTHDQEEAFELADRLGVMSFGRLLEVGEPAELYERPQTEFVASFLGTANLLIGAATTTGIQIGPHHFRLKTQVAEPLRTLGLRRVQVLFRPEDVAINDDVDNVLLGEGIIEQQTFAGPYERLRLRLPHQTGVLPVVPLLPFGQSDLWVEARRAQDQARRLPVVPGTTVRVGVRRIHALVHPGMNLLLLTDGSPFQQAAALLGGQLAQLAHARVTLLGCGESELLAAQLQALKDKFGGALAGLDIQQTPDHIVTALNRITQRYAYDLLVAATPPAYSAEFAEVALQTGSQHLLLLPKTHHPPSHALVCVTGSEPSKEDVLFTGRLLRHWGGRVTLLSVLSAPDAHLEQARIERFLVDSVRTLTVLGVPAETRLVHGPVRESILAQMHTGAHDLLALGAPLARPNQPIILSGLVRQLLAAQTEHPTLIIRSPYAVPVVSEE